MPPASSGKLRQIFVGPSGIRPGWRFLLFVLLLGVGFLIFGVVFQISAVARLQRSVSQGTLNSTFDIILELVSISAAFFAAFIVSHIEKGRVASYGIPLQGAFGKLFWRGVIWGLVFETVEMVIIYSFGGFSFGTFALTGARLFWYAAVWAVAFVLVGINEEFTFRGYAQFTLAQGMGFWPSAVLLSALFGTAHLANPNEGWMGWISVMLFGLFACLTLKRTGNLWFAIGFHAATDYAETFIYSVPDSGLLATGHLLNSSLHGSRWLTGGNIGPEGSIFDLLLLIVAFLLFAWLYPEKRQSLSLREDAQPEALS
jgi:uncharacterized protein